MLVLARTGAGVCGELDAFGVLLRELAGKRRRQLLSGAVRVRCFKVFCAVLSLSHKIDCAGKGIHC